MKTIIYFLLIPLTFILFSSCGDDDTADVPEKLQENGFTVNGQFFPCDGLAKTNSLDGDVSFIIAGGDYEIDFVNKLLEGESLDGIYMSFNTGGFEDLTLGSYTHDESLNSLNSFLAQAVTNFNTETSNGTEYYSAGNASSGSVKHSKVGNILTFEFTFKDEAGVTVSGYYSGKVDFTY